MKKKLTLYSATDVKKSVGKACGVIAYEEESRAEGAAANACGRVGVYTLNVSALSTLDLTEKDVPFSVIVAYALKDKKWSGSSRAELAALKAFSRLGEIDDYHYDVIKTYSFNGFCGELLEKYCLGEIDEETLEKVACKKDNVEYLIKSERAKKRVKAVTTRVVSPSAYSIEFIREQKQRKILQRAKKDQEQGGK